jgi:IS30 family transposase
LLRQYLPKSTDLSIRSPDDLDAITRLLNERPQKTLLFETPADRFNQRVAATS